MALSINPFYLACRVGDSVTLTSLLNAPFLKYDLNYGLQFACLGGHRAIVELMIIKGADNLNIGLQGACRGGHRAIVDFMIEKGANRWDMGLNGACIGGHRALVDLMIEKGANSWNWGLFGACYGGHRDLVDLMIEKGATELSDVISNFCRDKRFIAHIILRLKKQRRDNFIDSLRKEKHDSKNSKIIAYPRNYDVMMNSIIVYLKNHHIIRCASSHLLRTLYNVLQQFVCTDIATFSCRFVGMSYSE